MKPFLTYLYHVFSFKHLWFLVCVSDICTNLYLIFVTHAKQMLPSGMNCHVFILTGLV